MLSNLLKSTLKRSSIFCSFLLAPSFCSSHITKILDSDKVENDLFKEIIAEMTKDSDKIKNVEELIELYHTLDDSRKPSNISLNDIDYMLTLSTSSKKRFLNEKRKLEKKKAAQSLKKKEIKLSNQLKADKLYCNTGTLFDANGLPFYGKYNVSYFTYDKFNKYKRLYSMANLCNAYNFGQNLLIDFDYDQFMTLKQHVILVNQLKNIINELINDKNPFFITFCNFDNNALSCKFVKENLRLNDFPFHVTQKTYLDLFPKERLVYLTPDTDVLLNYNYNDVYVIGAMIDSGITDSFSLQKADKNKVKKARLPMQEEVTLKKSLSHLRLIEVFNILKDLKNGKNIQDSLLSTIPSKVYKDNEEFEQFIKKQQDKIQKQRHMLMHQYNMNLEEALSII